MEPDRSSCVMDEALEVLETLVAAMGCGFIVWGGQLMRQGSDEDNAALKRCGMDWVLLGVRFLSIVPAQKRREIIPRFLAELARKGGPGSR